MSERYWVTGVQLGLLEGCKRLSERKKVVQGIVDRQLLFLKHRDLVEFNPRNWNGCSLCKERIATERFEGFMGHTLYFCRSCQKKLKQGVEKNE